MLVGDIPVRTVEQKDQPDGSRVTVLTVLERYSDHESSLLLDCLVHDIREARSRALQQIGNSPCAVERASFARLRREDDPKAAAAVR